jgi:hypothetical protein
LDIARDNKFLALSLKSEYFLANEMEVIDLSNIGNECSV